MSTALNVGKALLKLTWGLLKITFLIARVAIKICDDSKSASRYNKLEAIELFNTGSITARDYEDATKS